MRIKIEKGKAVGSVLVPPSKSMAHRSLICGALSSSSFIKGLAASVDITATTNCLKTLGANIDTEDRSTHIGGLCPEKIPPCTIDCCESGSTLRFLIPICLLSENEITLKGSKRLLERPLSVYEEMCREKNLTFIQTPEYVKVKGPLRSGVYRIPGDISSQFISGLLFALPLCREDSRIEIIGNLESASYIELTLKSLDDFGIKTLRENNSFIIKGSQEYKSRSLDVEGDWSNSAFLDALTLLGGDVSVSGLDENSLQGDRVYRKLFKLLKEGSPTIDLTDCPDLAPILFTVAAALGGAEFIGTRRLKIKESDRANAMAEELHKFGIDVTVKENSVTVHKGILKTPDVELCGHNDHRIVMSMAVLCTLTGGIINQAEAVRKSFPDFFEKIKSLGIGIKEYET